MPQIIVYVDKFSGYSGTLTSATATLDGQTYTSSVVENGKIKFTLPNDGYFTVTSITTSNDYVLLQSDTISVTYGTQTCYIRTTSYSWSGVGSIDKYSTGGSSTDTVYYEISSTPPGFVVSWSGYYIDNGGTVHNISNSVPSSANKITILSPTAEDDDVDYIYITLTNYQGETQLKTYGTAPTTPMFKQQTIGGGARLQAGWYPGGRGGTFYGRMSITASIDGVENTRTDDTVQTFSS
jgi:hypothetical protein